MNPLNAKRGTGESLHFLNPPDAFFILQRRLHYLSQIKALWPGSERVQEMWNLNCRQLQMEMALLVKLHTHSLPQDSNAQKRLRYCIRKRLANMEHPEDIAEIRTILLEMAEQFELLQRLSKHQLPAFGHLADPMLN